jgi:hypothetical protein
LSEITREQLLDEAKSLAARQGQDFVLRTDFKRETGISDNQILKYFDSWTEFFEAAGLAPQVAKQISEQELMEAAHDALGDCKELPTFTRFAKLVPYSQGAYRRRWGTWTSFLEAFTNWVAEREPDFHLLSELRDRVVQPAASAPEQDATESSRAHKWSPTDGRRFGPFLNFRGLQHAPINEQGVVFLFGMVSWELGYVVESVATGFPDCEAKRRIKTSPETWQRLRLEFEYESRNFVDHGHDPTACDLIVCWKHNWDDCPIEVLELSSAIADLDDG